MMITRLTRGARLGLALALTAVAAIAAPRMAAADMTATSTCDDLPDGCSPAWKRLWTWDADLMSGDCWNTRCQMYGEQCCTVVGGES